ncbi:hypothetical protein HPB52_023792 [Rhipicephalus sanguineus]|uniref:RNase H type-1 domain-containing protein n=1 Tax=Rhipicephalus sanguineus TaxID=34632 RepID=A0A9D4Q3X2_RHISA|nr:hypothetical protein HPB52_023792 [Rhipicephalus sanguineus]
MRQAIADNAITCAALSMRIPEKRNPHVCFSGVDPDISNVDCIDRVRDRNPQLQLDPQTCKLDRFDFATPSVLSADDDWLVGDDTTFSEHRLVEVRVGDILPLGKRLTTYARFQLLEALRRDSCFTRVSGDSLASSDALDRVLDGFYALYTRLHRRHLRPVRARPTSKPWFTPALTIERAAVAANKGALAAKRRRFQRPPHPQMRAIFRQQYTSALAALRRNIREARDVHDVHFTYFEVVDVLRNTPNNSAPGPDLISPTIMKARFRFHPRFFLMIFNTALALGYFPRCWRKARVSFIHKPSRPPERTSSYRPICVSSVFGKTLERLLNGRLQYFLEKRGFVHPRQYGFTRGPSSLLALRALKAHLTRLKTQRMPAVLMSLDFHGAFDSVWHPLVLRYFRERALPSGLYHLLRTFLADRSVFVRSHAGQVEANPTLGSPQGSPLPPLLWNIDIASRRHRAGLRGRYYHSSAGALSRCTWQFGVCDKTFCVLCSRGFGGMERVNPTVRLAATEPTLQFRDFLRVLGVVFDRRLSFFHHADYLRQKVALLASRVAVFFAMQRSYFSPAHKLLMYRQVILPALTYGSPVWWSEDHVDCRLYASLITVQRVALFALTPAYRTTSTAAFQVLMHAPPIDLELERMNAEFRLFALRRHIAFGALRFRPSWVADAHEHVALHLSVPAAVPLMRLTSAQARFAARATAVHIYTDGSFTGASAGAAFVAFANPDRVLGVVAFQEALLHGLTAQYALPVPLYTDCLSLLQALASPRNAEPHVLGLRALLRRLSRSLPLHMFHVPGHTGVFGNEVADSLALRAAIHGHDRSLPLPLRAVRQQLRRELHVLWTARWREANTRTELYRWIQDLRKIPRFFPPPALLVTLPTGHGRFPHFFYRFNLMRETRCPCGSYCLDMAHVLHACPVTAPYTDRIEPQDAYRAALYAVILRCPRNSALLMGAVRALSDVLGMLTPHPNTAQVLEYWEVGLAQGPFRWGPRVSASLASNRSTRASFSGKTASSSCLFPWASGGTRWLASSCPSNGLRAQAHPPTVCPVLPPALQQGARAPKLLRPHRWISQWVTLRPLVETSVDSTGDLSGSSPTAQDVGLSPLGDDGLQDFTTDEVLCNFGNDNETLQHAVGAVDGVSSGSVCQSSGVHIALLRLRTHVMEHQKKIETILFDDKTKVSNSIRAQVITELNAIVKTGAEFQAAAAWRDGLVQELRRQLDDAKREAVDLRMHLLRGLPGLRSGFLRLLRSLVWLLAHQ